MCFDDIVLLCLRSQIKDDFVTSRISFFNEISWRFADDSIDVQIRPLSAVASETFCIRTAQAYWAMSMPSDNSWSAGQSFLDWLKPKSSSGVKK